MCWEWLSILLLKFNSYQLFMRGSNQFIQDWSQPNLSYNLPLFPKVYPKMDTIKNHVYRSVEGAVKKIELEPPAESGLRVNPHQDHSFKSVWHRYPLHSLWCCAWPWRHRNSWEDWEWGSDYCSACYSKRKSSAPVRASFWLSLPCSKFLTLRVHSIPNVHGRIQYPVQLGRSPRRSWRHARSCCPSPHCSNNREVRVQRKGFTEALDKIKAGKLWYRGVLVAAAWRIW